MGVLADLAADVFRYYETDGVPDSGKHKVKKSDVIGLFGAVETEIASLVDLLPDLSGQVSLANDNQTDAVLIGQGLSAHTNGGKLQLAQTMTGTSNVEYLMQRSDVTVSPGANSSGDFRPLRAAVSVALGNTRNVRKMAGLSGYAYHYGSGNIETPFGGTLQVFNERSGSMSSAVGALIAVHNNQPFPGETGAIAFAVGASALVDNFRNSGVGIAEANATYSRVANMDAGSISIARGVLAEIRNEAAGTIGQAIAVNANTLALGSGAISTAIGVSIQAQNPNGALTNYQALRIYAVSGASISGFHRAILSESTARSDFAGPIYVSGTQLTDYVFDQFLDGRLADDDADNIKALSFQPELLDPDAFARIWIERHALPNMPTRSDWQANGHLDIGDMQQRLWEVAEVQAVHIHKLNQHIKALEAAA